MHPTLADVNVWLATLVAEHPHHEATIRWWREEVLPVGATVALCRLTQLGLSRLLSNARVMGRQRLNHAQAWAALTDVSAQANVCYLDEPAGIEDLLADHCNSAGSSPGFWSDAYLAAFARAGGHRFVTFDQGFRRFTGLDLSLLDG